MNKDLQYTGYTAVPSDYECPDGQLSQSLNLISENGALHPIMPPKEILRLEAGSEIVFIHKTSSFEHYMVQTSDGYVKWIDAAGKTTADLRANPFVSLNHINAIGNTLVVFTETETVYFLWKDGSYKELGNGIPSIQLSFGLVGHPKLYSHTDGKFTIEFDGINESDLYGTFSDANKTKITSQIMAKVNKFIATETTNKGRFCFPFFVRYALRLYDGTLTGHSAPILMNPSTCNCPVVLWDHIKGEEKVYTSAELDIMMVAATLDYAIVDNVDLLISDWSDIVKNVDVFISKPIYTFDQSGECTSFADSDNFESSFIGRLKPYESDDAFATLGDKVCFPPQFLNSINGYAEWKYSQIFALCFSDKRKYYSKTIHLPEFTDDKNTEQLRNVSTFYKLHSIDISEINTYSIARKDIVVDEEYLQSLVTREVMTDDYLSRDKLCASQSFAYNSRLNLSGVRRKLFGGFQFDAMVGYCNASYDIGISSSNEVSITPSSFTYSTYTVDVYIKENGETHKVSAPASGIMTDIFSSLHDYTNTVSGESVTELNKVSWGAYLFYPNVNAFKMVITNQSHADEETGSPLTLVIDLQPHEFLNGAYALLEYNRIVKDNWDNDNSIPSISTMPTEELGVVSVPSKVYTSEVNNPFFFPLTGINTVGTGRIMGICSAAKALSQGQFGQFPLYAFTDEGVWAMEVSATGSYSAKQPITRDVCVNSKSITQIDSAVLFATARGVMLISGSQTQCLTDILNAPDFFDLNSLPGLAKLYPGGLPTIDCTFADYLSQVRMSYDYVNQRIILFNPSKEYAYVYSMKSQLWGIMESQLISAVNSYPDALAMASDGDDNVLVDLGRTDSSAVPGLLVTRPLKLDLPDIHKTIDTIIQRGNFQKGHVQSVLYGSRDLINWHLVWSSKDHFLRGFRGTPYKYFRIALLCNLAADESIYGASIQFSPRLNNQPR